MKKKDYVVLLLFDRERSVELEEYCIHEIFAVALRYDSGGGCEVGGKNV